MKLQGYCSLQLQLVEALHKFVWHKLKFLFMSVYTLLMLIAVTSGHEEIHMFCTLCIFITSLTSRVLAFVFEEKIKMCQGSEHGVNELLSFIGQKSTGCPVVFTAMDRRGHSKGKFDPPTELNHLNQF